ncbi:cellulose binding domain-containing protein [Streptomyces sp. TLI_171]|uniref:cellulose binding domain-containing protein n=1 Tax=Streptomyces sp. TLI_171 TaxID=1938859 RepID=UPI000C187F01|nr:cellulose binding domain-containing protein [Streptomyces sp. TLI_171]RKE17811.1 cellulase (glycosyl hydrolase family 5) [Streptomyces sp. TLI_171]
MHQRLHPRRAARFAPTAFLLATAVAAAGLTLGRADTAQADTADAFATRCGIHFCLNGKEYYVAGANTYDLFTYGGSYGDTETQFMDKARIDAQFANFQADKVDVVRLWMFSHESWHGFEKSKGVYDEQEFAEFDYIVQSAKAHNVRLVPVFENYWEAYGGIDTRLQWEGLSGGQPGRAAFFDKARCPGCFASYKNYVSYALNRVNHYSGVKYKDDPTIFAWDLMNEPRYQDQSAAENVNGTTLRAWVDEMGAFVKSIDSKHLLGAGIEGHGSTYGFGGDEGNPFVAVQQSPYLDYTSAHPYPTESWANLSLDQTKALIRSWIADSHQKVGKPFFMGEFNVHNVDRSAWWSELYADFEAAGGDGSAFWWYQDRSADGKFGVSAGSPELVVFRAHSDRMRAKSGLTTGTSSPSQSAGPSPSQSPSPSASSSPSSSPSTPPPAGSCAVHYGLSDWGSTFNGDVTIKNTGTTAVNGWRLVFSFPGNQQVTNMWNAVPSQSGKQVTATNPASYNTSIAAGGTVNFGFSGSSVTGTNGAPTAFALNGAACTTY